MPFLLLLLMLRRNLNMKFTKKPYDPTSLGLFLDLSLTSCEAWQVKLENDGMYRATVHLALPKSRMAEWPAGICAVLRRIMGYRNWTVRMDYNNVALFLTVESLKSLEKLYPQVSFYVYNAPKNLAVSEAPSSLDVDKIKLRVDRKKYATQRERRRAAREAYAQA